MAGVQGFEPQNGGIKTRCLTAWLYPCRTVVAKIVQFDDYTATSIKWQGYRDSNPRMAGSKPAALPLGYTPAETAEFLLAWCGKRDSNSHASRRWNLNPVRLPISPFPQTLDEQIKWWLQRESNLRPQHYECCALTS